MYRIKKVLNHNTVIGIRTDNQQEYLIMGKGIGFGKKVSERFETGSDASVYSLQVSSERGDAREMVKEINPECLEIASEVLDEAEKMFGKIDRSILFPMADHIEFAIKRMRSGEQISNPLTEDIRILFHMEYKAASCIAPILARRMNLRIEEDEVGYIALHIHSAIEDEKVSQAMQMARAVRECISLVEEEIGRPIDVMSLSYNRLMNHIRYMVARAISGEKLKVNMNDYMGIKFPHAFQTAKAICERVGKSLKCTLGDAEIGYLAMHIERVTSDELDAPEE
ncbi:PRD domain-containing protein [Faecalicatena contorta]|uniref:PRD domain-containing protein n=1 Tax=Faecalicatena contorta TaxID=39482 RepID=UPI001F48FE50|nr:PRD domain-containing protein [Faecalicatena contorta]MCF2679271.1 PRD domain-containing protein [Faecalicatena contorta]